MPTQARLDRIDSVLAKRQEGIVVLEDIQDPHNAQAVIRTCDAFGFQKVCFIFQGRGKFDPRKIGNSSSSGSNKWLDYETWDSAEACFSDLKGRGYATFATILDPSAKPLASCDLTSGKVALVFGNETLGISEAAARLADHKVYLPMNGMVESLNLSVTAALCLFETDRQRRAAGTQRPLPAAEITRLRAHWIKLSTPQPPSR